MGLIMSVIFLVASYVMITFKTLLDTMQYHAIHSFKFFFFFIKFTGLKKDQLVATPPPVSGNCSGHVI